MRLLSVGNIQDEFIGRLGGGAITKFLGGACGSQKIYVNIDVLPPGAYSAKYHAHSLQEEFFMILKGNGMLRTDGGQSAVRQGDIFAKPCGKGNPHQFYNSGDVPLEILDVGTVEKGDIGYYPDEGIRLLRDEHVAFRDGSALRGWDSDPNA